MISISAKKFWYFNNQFELPT